MVIKNGAIFIADAHYNKTREELIDFITQIKEKAVVCTQLFLMGDIFDFLCDEVDYFQEVNYRLIGLIDEISHHVETIYFEGNHDFSLEDTFPKVKVISRNDQPIYTQQNGKKLALAHGDIYTPTAYNIYCTIIRNPYVLNFLNLIDINNWLSKKTDKDLQKKYLCGKQENFEQFIKNRVEKYKVDLVIEGHYHQNFFSDNYINLPSFACDKQYVHYIDDEFKLFKV
jgi:UDP-2,3-diacylglucosamine hydrolase